MILLYIDPGSGSLLISTLIGILVTLVYTLKGFFYNISYFFFGRGTSDFTKFPGELVFFSEGRQYWRVFEPVINELVNQGQKVIYLSADEKDEGLSYSSDLVETHHLEHIKKAIFTLNRLHAKVCVMTTPQLDILAMRRSRNVAHYCHIIHSPTDIHAYKKFAFDFFDSILCSSTAQMENLRFLEKERGTTPKQLFETGCSYYDTLQVQDKSSRDKILLAPTWGDRTFFKYHGKEIIAQLLQGNHSIVFRPHPQSWISDKELMDEIVSQFGSNPSFVIDKEIGGEKALQDSKVLICDITSGMLFDMVFVHRKPVVALNVDWPDGGYESSDLLKENSAIDLIKEVGFMVDTNQVGNISEIVNEAIDKEISDETTHKHIFNFQETGKVAADQVLSIYKEIS